MDPLPALCVYRLQPGFVVWFSLWVDTPPRWCPEPWALPGRCPGGRGPGNRGRSGWSRTPSCGEPRSRWPCRTRRWCWTCPRRKWAGGPTLPGAASEPGRGNFTILNHTIQPSGFHVPREIRKRKCFLVYLASLLAVREVTVSGEPTGGEGFTWVWVLWALQREVKGHHIILNT